MSNETPVTVTVVEVEPIKWYNKPAVRVSFGLACVAVGSFFAVYGVSKGMIKRNAIMEAGDAAEDALRTLAELGAKSLDTASDVLDDAGERLGDLAN